MSDGFIGEKCSGGGAGCVRQPVSHYTSEENDMHFFQVVFSTLFVYTFLSELIIR